MCINGQRFQILNTNLQRLGSMFLKVFFLDIIGDHEFVATQYDAHMQRSQHEMIKNMSADSLPVQSF